MIHTIRNDLTQFCDQISSVKEPLPDSGKLQEVVKRVALVVGYLFARPALALLNLIAGTPVEHNVAKPKMVLTQDNLSYKLEALVQKLLNSQGKQTEKQDCKIFLSFSADEMNENRVVLVTNSRYDKTKVGDLVQSHIQEEIAPLFKCCTQKLNFKAEIFIREEKTFDHFVWSNSSHEHGKKVEFDLLQTNGKSLDFLDTWLKQAANACGLQGDQVTKQLDDNHQFLHIIET